MKEESPYEPGEFVAYYLEGWRYGYWDSVKKGTAKIRPMSAYKAGLSHFVKVPVDSVKKSGDR